MEGVEERMAQSGGVPMYESIRSVLAHEIASGRFSVEEALPTESQLCARFKVSRITIRRAVGLLESDGLILRKQGKGTFVAPGMERPHAELSLGSLEGVSEGGEYWSREVVSSEVLPAAARVAQLLDVPEGSSVFHLIRVFSSEGSPSFIDETFYSLLRYPGLDSFVSGAESTYRVLRENYGVVFTSMERDIGIVYATTERAAWLRCSANDALIRVDKIARGRGGAPVHLSRLDCVPSRVTLKFETGEDESSHIHPTDRQVL